MTPLRQASSTAALFVGLSFALPTSAEPLAPMGPPTAAEAAQAVVAPAPVAPPVASPPAASAAGAKPTPSWLASRPAPKAAPVAGKSALPSSGRIAGMLLVLGALGGAALYFKRRGKSDGNVAAVKERLLVVSSTRIGPKAHAVVISVHGRQMLLGVTDSSVKRLAFLDEVEDEVEERQSRRGTAGASRGAAIAVRAVTADPARGRSFAELLKTAFKRPETPVEESAAAILAAETRDVIASKPVAPAAPAPVRMLDVEGQAQGLLRRLGGPRT